MALQAVLTALCNDSQILYSSPCIMGTDASLRQLSQHSGSAKPAERVTLCMAFGKCEGIELFVRHAMSSFHDEMSCIDRGHPLHHVAAERTHWSRGEHTEGTTMQPPWQGNGQCAHEHEHREPCPDGNEAGVCSACCSTLAQQHARHGWSRTEGHCLHTLEYRAHPLD